MEAIIEDEGASLALRKHVAARYPVAGRAGPRRARRRREDGRARRCSPACDAQPALPQPAVPPPPRLRRGSQPVVAARDGRRQRGDAQDPLGAARRQGPDRRVPRGRRRRCGGQARTTPVDLDDPRLLAQDGWAPSEGNPQFHQQMVYAVAMKTIEHFERALGRPVLWRPRPNPENPNDDSGFVRPAAPAARAAAGQRLLQPGRGRAAVRLLRGRRPTIPATTCRAAASTPASRTTSSRTRRPTPSSTACTAASTSRPTRTCWRCTRRSPTSSR